MLRADLQGKGGKSASKQQARTEEQQARDLRKKNASYKLMVDDEEDRMAAEGVCVLAVR